MVNSDSFSVKASATGICDLKLSCQRPCGAFGEARGKPAATKKWLFSEEREEFTGVVREQLSGSFGKILLPVKNIEKVRFRAACPSYLFHLSRQLRRFASAIPKFSLPDMKPYAYLVLSGLPCGTAAAVEPPGIPEPSLVLYGTVSDSGTHQPVTLTSVSWQATDGTESAALTATSAPPARLITESGQSYYLTGIPFDTRTVQNAFGPPLTLLRNGLSLELKSPSPDYTLTPIINGRRATIRSIDGTPASAAVLRLTNSPESSGRMLRVELTLPPEGSYTSWALTQFPDPDSPKSLPTADPDQDGQTNEAEFAAGTDPRNNQSSLQISGTTRDPGTALITLTWSSVPGKSYQIERTITLGQAAWKPVSIRRRGGVLSGSPCLSGSLPP